MKRKIRPEDAIKELKRELDMRNKWYPTWIKDASKPWMTREVATRQRNAIRDALHYIEARRIGKPADGTKIKEWINEIQRELEYRQRNYPTWITTGKLHRDRANRQYLRLEKAKEILVEFSQGKEAITKIGNQQSLF